ncbi:MAG: family 10 glycosylhydrolase, partial [Eggerthellaceae bacterium]|nr:family 10 glycosylhydrolase [Eggerthellaceae bacterium]
METGSEPGIEPTQEQPPKRHRGLIVSFVVLVFLIICTGTAAAFLWLNTGSPSSSSSGRIELALPANDKPAASQPAAPPSNRYNAIPLPSEMRAMWISFQELWPIDFTSEDATRQAVDDMFDNCKGLGLNTVIVMVRPYSDALYPSSIFPFSHLIGGTQGTDPGFDPLGLMVEEAHARGLRIEAWVSPYKVSDASGPGHLDPTNPAVLHPEWTVDVNGETWYDPGLPEVRDLVRDGVKEIVDNYDVDGIHMDDYFYPDYDEGANAFDAGSYATYGNGASLADWRRANTDAMLQEVYAAIKASNSSVSFGVSPQGDNNVNYQQEYANVAEWLATPGYADYVMPQLYWGFNYLTAGGSDQFSFATIAATWASLPRDPSVKLYAGLAAYHIGLAQTDGSRAYLGDGGANDQSEWSSGHELADMVAALRGQGSFSGFAL